MSGLSQQRLVRQLGPLRRSWLRPPAPGLLVLLVLDHLRFQHRDHLRQHRHWIRAITGLVAGWSVIASYLDVQVRYVRLGLAWEAHHPMT